MRTMKLVVRYIGEGSLVGAFLWLPTILKDLISPSSPSDLLVYQKQAIGAVAIGVVGVILLYVSEVVWRDQQGGKEGRKGEEEA